MTGIKKNRAWFFTTIGDSQVNGWWQRFVGGGISKPKQQTLENLLESTPFFEESGSAASVDTTAALTDKQGLVVLSSDANAKSGTNTALGSTGGAVVVQPSHLPTTIASKLNVSDIDIDGTDTALAGGTKATLLAGGLDITAQGTVKATVDSSVTTRNKYFYRFSNYVLNWLATSVVPFLLPSMTLNSGKYLTTNGTVPSWDAVNISTAVVTGVLPIINGGTGQTTLPGYKATSVSSNVIGIGTKIFTIGTGYSFATGNRVRVTDSLNSANFVEGNLTDYSAGDITIDVDTKVGSGTKFDWLINLGSGRDIYNCISTSNIDVELGNKTFVIGTGYNIKVGNRLRFSETTNDANFVDGIVYDYTAGNVSMSVDYIGGTGNISSWVGKLGSVPVNIITATNITAFPGGGQAGATILSAKFNEITTCATDHNSVILPTAVTGTVITVKNNGATILDVYPFVADAINTNGANNSVSLAPGTLKVFTAISSTIWETSNEKVSVDAGSATLPSYTFDAQKDMGLYKVSSTELGVVVGGSKIISLNTGLSGAKISNISEVVFEQGINFRNAITIHNITSTVNATQTISVSQFLPGCLTSTSAAPVTITLPTATSIGTALGATQGTVYEFIVDNTAGSNTVTIAVGAGIVICSAIITGSTTMTVAASATQGIGVFRLVFSSATAAVLYRIG